MKKLKLAVLFGGVSTEHNVSILSGASVLKNLDDSKYDIFPIYISKEGIWYKSVKDLDTIKLENMSNGLECIDNIFQYLKQMDVVFPVLHGLYGEDGTIQGLLKLINVPYVGCDVLSSSICMDKVYTKQIFKSANIPQVKYMYVKRTKEGYKYIDEEFNEINCDIKYICNKAIELIGFPMFIKPSNSGSSVGINKATKKQELIKYIKYASRYDSKILIEQGINARELECAVLGNDTVEISCIGEILSGDEFYSYDSKYKNNSSKTIIPADISDVEEKYIKDLVKRVFTSLDCRGLSRIDFFLDKDSKNIYVNEINTMPGFTDISMYPKLFEHFGIGYTELLDRLINLAIF